MIIIAKIMIIIIFLLPLLTINRQHGYHRTALYNSAAFSPELRVVIKRMNLRGGQEVDLHEGRRREEKASKGQTHGIKTNCLNPSFQSLIQQHGQHDHHCLHFAAVFSSDSRQLV